MWFAWKILLFSLSHFNRVAKRKNRFPGKLGLFIVSESPYPTLCCHLLSRSCLSTVCACCLLWPKSKVMAFSLICLLCLLAEYFDLGQRSWLSLLLSLSGRSQNLQSAWPILLLNSKEILPELSFDCVSKFIFQNAFFENFLHVYCIHIILAFPNPPQLHLKLMTSSFSVGVGMCNLLSGLYLYMFKVFAKYFVDESKKQNQDFSFWCNIVTTPTSNVHSGSRNKEVK